MLDSVVIRYWEIINLADFDMLEGIFDKDAMILLPNTDEAFHSVKDFIQFNKDYPGKWHASIEMKEEVKDLVISITRVWNDDNSMSFFVTSVFKIINGKILRMEEYWAENSQRPEWRRDNKYTYDIARQAREERRWFLI